MKEPKEGIETEFPDLSNLSEEEKSEVIEMIQGIMGVKPDRSAKPLVEVGNRLAKAQGYKTLKGRRAIQYFLMQKHNWTPSTVKGMSSEDLLFAISEESL